MRVKIDFDDQGYVLHFMTDWINGNMDVDDDFQFEYLHCYHLVNDELILDEEKKAIQIQREENAIEIQDLKKKLSETDYIFAQEVEEISSLSNPVTFITDLIKILVSYSTKYKDIISNRKAWRDRIKELEG